MTINGSSFASDILNLKATDKRHVNYQDTTSTKSFSSMLEKSIEGVNEDLNKPLQLGLQAQLSPDTVNPHDISIAILKSNLEIQTLKQVTEKSIQAYKDIINIR